MTWETRKIMDLPDLAVSCTAVRIPTLRAHAEAITIETEKPCSPEQAKEILAASPGVASLSAVLLFRALAIYVVNHSGTIGVSGTVLRPRRPLH